MTLRPPPHRRRRYHLVRRACFSPSRLRIVRRFSWSMPSAEPSAPSMPAGEERRAHVRRERHRRNAPAIRHRSRRPSRRHRTLHSQVLLHCGARSWRRNSNRSSAMLASFFMKCSTPTRCMSDIRCFFSTNVRPGTAIQHLKPISTWWKRIGGSCKMPVSPRNRSRLWKAAPRVTRPVSFRTAPNSARRVA